MEDPGRRISDYAVAAKNSSREMPLGLGERVWEKEYERDSLGERIWEKESGREAMRGRETDR